MRYYAMQCRLDDDCVCDDDGDDDDDDDDVLRVCYKMFKQDRKYL